MNHDDHYGHDGQRFRMRGWSPLSAEAEQAMTRVIDCAMAVHRALGPGFIESIYKQAMQVEMRLAGVSFESERSLTVDYRGVPLHGQRVDLIVEGKILVELKAVARLDDVHRAQLISYLRASGFRGGLLINFRVSLLHYGIRRIVL